jgi:hypothetical protein
MEAIQMIDTYRGSPAPDDRNEQTDVLAALDVLPVDRKLLQGRQGMIAATILVVFVCCRGSGHC